MNDFEGGQVELQNPLPSDIALDEWERLLVKTESK